MHTPQSLLNRLLLVVGLSSAASAACADAESTAKPSASDAGTGGSGGNQAGSAGSGGAGTAGSGAGGAGTAGIGAGGTGTAGAGVGGTGTTSNAGGAGGGSATNGGGSAGVSGMNAGGAPTCAMGEQASEQTFCWQPDGTYHPPGSPTFVPVITCGALVRDANAPCPPPEQVCPFAGACDLKAANTIGPGEKVGDDCCYPTAVCLGASGCGRPIIIDRFARVARLVRAAAWG